MDLVLARKYRPGEFDEVVGQESTITQLMGAIKNNSLGHALLFSGTRGTGKTTTARIISKVLNPSLNPAELSLSTTELDAASNSGVDDIRSIIETVKYSTAGHRVVIIDECHQLSKAAFNALLKTLEEPPSRVTFILVTTEPNKLPATVRSRCQVYEFRDVDLETLKGHYKKVAQSEGLELTDEQLQEVALRAEGSVRDGLSLLQKFLSGETVNTNADKYFQLVGAIYSNDASTALSLVGELRKEEEPRVIIQTLERWFYWCSLMRFGLSTPITDFFEAGVIEYFDLGKLQRLFAICLDAEAAMAKTPNSKIVLDMFVLSLSQEQ